MEKRPQSVSPGLPLLPCKVDPQPWSFLKRFHTDVPYINRFLQPDTVIPDQTIPQNFNRFSYVRNNPIRYNDPTGHDTYITCLICDITWLTYSQVSGAANAVVDTISLVSCLIAGCHVDTKNYTVTGPTTQEWANAGIFGMASPIDVPPSSANALQKNFEHGLELLKKRQLKEYLDFFLNGLSDGPVPKNVPVKGLQETLDQIDGNLYVVGKPDVGKDLDIILVQEKPYTMTNSQTTLNNLAQDAGFTDIHLQVMTPQQAAAFRFATSSTTPLHAVPNLRNPMQWRLVRAE